MSVVPLQTPLGVNSLSALMQNANVFTINNTVSTFIGTSTSNTDYSPGKLITDTVLWLITLAINDGYIRGVDAGDTLTDAVYDQLISIGSNSIPALGNSISSAYVIADPSGVWTSKAQYFASAQGVTPNWPGPATSGYALTSNVGFGQQATWYPYDTTNTNVAVTQWGYLRLHALQAWNEFNWSGLTPTGPNVMYEYFCDSFIQAYNYIKTNNPTTYTLQNSLTYDLGTYSNMNDVISANILGVNSASLQFGIDLENLGNALSFSVISAFGMPSALLYTLLQNSAITSDLAIALLAAGITEEHLSLLGSRPYQAFDTVTEQNIYGAFLIITGDSLSEILSILSCTTQNITTLADLLNVRKLFPLSYGSLTVPLPNLVSSESSKVYYPIFMNNGVNSALSSPEVVNIVGTIVIPGEPNTQSYTGSLQPPPVGFDSYLVGILPNTLAIPAGAFSYSMRQIRNIESLSVREFAQVVQGLEIVNNLPLANSSGTPIDTTSVSDVIDRTKLGSGPYGTYTMSDFFGCMSGLPYPIKLLYERLKQLPVESLYNIYKDLFLAVTWQEPTVTLNYESYTGPGPSFDTYYRVTGVSIVDPGGGYGRGGAPAPTITISDGTTVTVTIGTDFLAAGSDGSGTYGRLTSINIDTAGTDGTTIPTLTIEYPPITPNGGVNSVDGTVGWPNMNDVVTAYISQSNTEISNIANTYPNIVGFINTYWSMFGQQLAIEQRARYIAIPPVSVPKNIFETTYPAILYDFINSTSEFAIDTLPHQTAQTLENIVNADTLGGQNIIALLRQNRNQSRLSSIGIPLSNEISNNITDTETRALLANGTIATDINGLNNYTTPSWASTNPVPLGRYIQPYPGYEEVNAITTGDITPILLNIPNPVVATNVVIGPAERIRRNSSVPLGGIYPPLLNPWYTSGILMSGRYTVEEALHSITECNCDFWCQ